jgi:hypothetical protein
MPNFAEEPKCCCLVKAALLPGALKTDVAGENPFELLDLPLILKYYLFLDSVDLLRISFRTITDILF